MNYKSLILNKIQAMRAVHPDISISSEKYWGLGLVNNSLCGFVSDTIDCLSNAQEIAFIRFSVYYPENKQNEWKRYIVYKGNVYEGGLSIGRRTLSMSNFTWSYCDGKMEYKLPNIQPFDPTIYSMSFEYLLKALECKTDLEIDFLAKQMYQGAEIQKLKERNIALEAACDTYKQFIDHLVGLLNK